MELVMDIKFHCHSSPLPLWERVARREAACRERVGASGHDRVENAIGVAQHLIHSAAAGVTSASSTGGGARFGASFSSAIRASRSRASWASRCRFHILA